MRASCFVFFCQPKIYWMNEIKWIFVIYILLNMLPKIIFKRNNTNVICEETKINSIFICVRSHEKNYIFVRNTWMLWEERQKMHRQVTFFSPLIFKNSIVWLFISHTHAINKFLHDTSRKRKRIWWWCINEIIIIF